MFYFNFYIQYSITPLLVNLECSFVSRDTLMLYSAIKRKLTWLDLTIQRLVNKEEYSFINRVNGLKLVNLACHTVNKKIPQEWTRKYMRSNVNRQFISIIAFLSIIILLRCVG